MKKLITYIKKIDSRFFSYGDPLPLDILRFSFGFLAFIKLASLAPHFQRWFSDSGWLPRESVFFMRGQEVFFSVLRWLPGDHFTLAIFFLALLSSLTLMLGYRTKLSAWTLFLAMVSLDHRSPYIMNGGDRVLRNILFCIALAQTGRSFTIHTGFSLKTNQKVPLWPQHLLQIQIALIYLSTFSAKIIQSEAWTHGWALRLIQTWKQYETIPYPSWFMASNLPEIFTYLTLVVELALGTLVFSKKYKLPVVLGGIGLHLGISLLINIPLFGLYMIFSYVAFFEGNEIRQYWNNLRNFLPKRARA